MKTTKLALQPYKNISGTTSWRITGWFLGDRVRKNFKDKQEALAEKSALEIHTAQADSGMRSTGTFLTDEQLREAEALFLRTKDKPRTLTFYVDYAFENYQEPTSTKPLANALTEYLAHRTAEHGRGLISDAQLSTIRKHTERLKKFFPRVLVSDLTAERVTAYCARGNAMLKTHNNRRGILSTFLKFSHAKGWIAANPIDKVPHYRIAHKRGTAPTLNAVQSAALMDYVENYHGGILVPFFALALFAGVRPDYRNGELAKLRADAVNLETGVIHIEPDVSKVDMKRNITIQPNLDAWLRAYPLEKYPPIVKNICRLRTRIGKQFGLSHDVLRHTFISMHVAKFRSMGDTALQAGNSEEIIRKHYLDVKSRSEAEAFFSIMPKKAPALDAVVIATAESIESHQLAA